MTRCSSCNAEIIWIKTPTGKRMPLDAKPEKRIIRMGRMGEGGILRDTYTSHFATCPNADQHRKRRAA